MNRANFVQVQLAQAATDIQTTLVVKAPVGGLALPPAGGGRLVLTDSPGRPMAFEIVDYTGRTGSGPFTLTGVTRGVEGTVGLAWGVDTFVLQSLTVGELNSLLAAKANTTDARFVDAREWTGSTVTQSEAEVGTATTRRAWTAQRVRQAIAAWWDGSAAKTQLDVATAGVNGLTSSKLDASANAVSATKLATARNINGVPFDGTANITVVDATKEPAFAAGTTAQYRRGDKSWQDFATAVRAAVLTGLSTATSTAVAATDSVLAAIGKLQAQVTALGTSKLDASANAVSATKLATARNINGVPFDGTANITVVDATKEPAFAAGTTAQYRRGDKSWQDFATAVRGSVLAGLSTASAVAVTAADTVLVGVGKLQAQVTALSTSKLDASGSGGQLTGLNASNLSSGTVDEARLPDSGVQYPSLVNSFSVAGMTTAQRVKFRKVGKVVTISGAVSRSTNAGFGVTVFTLPVGYRPYGSTLSICHGSSAEPFTVCQKLVQVTPEGLVSMVWDVLASPPAGVATTWDINITFLVP